MATFQRGETIAIKGEIRDEDNVLITPATSTKITVTGPAGTLVVNDQDVSFDSVGIYKYLYTPAESAIAGAYHIRVIATDGARKSTTDSEFFLVI